MCAHTIDGTITGIFPCMHDDLLLSSSPSIDRFIIIISSELVPAKVATNIYITLELGDCREFNHSNRILARSQCEKIANYRISYYTY